MQQQIRMLAVDLGIGETLQCVCPFCGAEHEKSFSITRISAGLLYNCYRASCKAHGFVSSIPGTQLEKKKKEFEPKVFTRPLSGLSAELRRWLIQKYYLTSEEIANNGIRYDYTDERLYFPLFDFFGHTVGAIAKRIVPTKKHGNSEGAKTIVYWFNDVPKVHFPHTIIEEGPLVVVEDTISAIRVARHFRAAALLGTNLTQDVVNHLCKITQDIVVALDADTWDHQVPLALRFKQKYGLFFRNFWVVKLSKDPKDTQDNELKELLLNAIRTKTA